MQDVPHTGLVLGAGASREVGLPVGEGLKTRIREALDFRIDEFGRAMGGDTPILNALHSHSHEKLQRHLQPLLDAAKAIHNGLPLAISIDHFLHQRADDELIAVVGKLAIVRQILRAENESKLRFHDTAQRRKHVDIGTVSGTWFGHFFRGLTEGCGRADLATRFKDVAVVSFNYDRCFEHFMLHAVELVYGLPRDEAVNVVSGIEVQHPYGRVGCLQWWQQPGEQPVGFGEEISVEQLRRVATEIKTFTEGTDPASSHIQRIRRLMKGARRVVFLGFHYHEQNVELLYGNASLRAGMPHRACLGTALDFSPRDLRAVMDHMQRFEQTARAPLLQGVTCTKLFTENSRDLRFT